MGKIVPKDANFAGFNLLLLAPVVQSDETIKYDSLYVTNHGGGGELESRLLAPIECSCGGMSNGVDGAGASSWPKVRQATDDFASLLQSLETPGKKESDEAEESALVEGIFRILSWVFLFVCLSILGGQGLYTYPRDFAPRFVSQTGGSSQRKGKKDTGSPSRAPSVISVLSFSLQLVH